MDNEFNPFDLSAQKPKSTDENGSQKDIPRPKPTVRRVTMGPLFHSRITKVIAFILGIILAGLVGYTGMNYYLTQKAAKTVNLSTTTSQTAEKPSSSIPANTPTPTPTTELPATSSPKQTSAPETKVYCGVSSMPEGVCVAIASIEKDGLKNNKYVAQSTADVPDGIKVTIDKSSWKTASADSSSVTFTASTGGVVYKGSGIFKQVSGVWKVTDFTLST